jgi:hypothetical protein
MMRPPQPSQHSHHPRMTAEAALVVGSDPGGTNDWQPQRQTLLTWRWGMFTALRPFARPIDTVLSFSRNF